jgi:hypothetical protein
VPDALDPMALRQSANQSTEHRQPPFVVRTEPPFVVPMEGPRSSVDHTEYRGLTEGCARSPGEFGRAKCWYGKGDDQYNAQIDLHLNVPLSNGRARDHSPTAHHTHMSTMHLDRSPWAALDLPARVAQLFGVSL